MIDIERPNEKRLQYFLANAGILLSNPSVETRRDLSLPRQVWVKYKGNNMVSQWLLMFT